MMALATETALQLTEQGYLPDRVIRHGIRRLLAERLIEIRHDDCEQMASFQQDFIRQMNEGPIADIPEKANEQHYEIPASFYDQVLGSARKYSSCYWPEGTSSLDEAEILSLRQTCERAMLSDGQKILELGCGWGSLTLWMATNYSDVQITAVSNSHSQGEYIRSKARELQLDNIEVITADMNDFSTSEKFDRVVSIEMFEHMRNWKLLYSRIADWLNPGGKFFKHIFVNRGVPYLFLDKDESDWMSRHFFSGGMMPSDDLPLHFQDDLAIVNHWRWNGRHYEKTLNAWLEAMDNNRAAVWPILEQTYGKDQTKRWWMRWRIFFMACAELFGYNNGQEWYIGHYLFEKRN